MPIIRVTHPDISNLLPSQLGQPGEYLRTDGTSVSWEPADALPTQTGNANKFLKTDGTSSSWDTVDHTHSHADELPSQSGQAGEFLKTDGTTATWEPVTHPEELPTQTGQSGEFLQTNGTTASWEPINLSGATEHGFSYINAAQTFAASIRALIDTAASALSFNMPASPTLGDTVRCADAAGTMSTNYATIEGNGNTFTTAAGVTDTQFIINTNGADVGFVWNGSTWRIY